MNDRLFQKILQKEMTRKEFIIWGAALVGSVLGITGLIRRINSHAATLATDKEAEDGTLAGGATVLSSTAASGGQAVKFGQAAAPTGVLDVGSSKQANGDLGPFETTVGAVFESHRTYFSATQQSGAATMIKTDIAAGRKCSSLSFKLPYSWAEMANGAGDTWARNLLATLQAANSGTHRVRIAFHHEPENDTGTNDGSTDAGRDAWKAMQARLAPIFDVPNFQFVCILMGYHSFTYGGASADDVARWNLDAAIPKIAAVKGVGFDLYQKKDVDGVTKWNDLSKYYVAIGSWAKTNNKAWGISETGVAATAFSSWSSSGLTWMKTGDYFQDLATLMKANGGSWLEYFNSDLNSPDPKWSMTATEPRGVSYGKLLKQERAN
jgi:hypothetical protein